MPLSDSDRKRISYMLNRMSDYEKKRALSSERSFGNWLCNSLYSVYVKVKSAVSSMWNWIRSLF